MEERPLLKALLDSEEGSALYRRYLAELLELWIDTGLLQSEIDRIAEMVRPWVAQETLTVYSLAEHDQAVESVGKFVSYRAQSVRGQLEGTIPSTQEGQISAPDLLPDFSDYAPPESGIMKVLLPEAESGEVSGEALLQVLPEANANLYDTVSILALLNLVDWGQVMSMDLSAMGSEDSDEPADPEKEAAVKRALLSFLPYVFDLAGILLTFIAVPVVILLALRYARRWRRKGGVRRVV